MLAILTLILFYLVTIISSYTLGHDIGYKRGYKEGTIDEQYNQRTP